MEQENDKALDRKKRERRKDRKTLEANERNNCAIERGNWKLSSFPRGDY